MKSFCLTVLLLALFWQNLWAWKLNILNYPVKPRELSFTILTADGEVVWERDTLKPYEDKGREISQKGWFQAVANDEKRNKDFIFYGGSEETLQIWWGGLGFGFY